MNSEVAERPLVPEKRAIDALIDALREINNLSHQKPSLDSYARIQRLSAQAMCEARTVKDKMIGRG